ncbi:MAG TPA: DUF3089 domain-containing protein [Hyphomonadaceae bacterium]|nr:DUF3089 domain-containing protein [Hyphomonadaceae bacterium]
MFNDPRLRRIALASVAGGVAVLGLGWLALQDTFFRMAVHPPGRFATTPAPTAPDYSKRDSWAARPALPPPGAWETPWGIDVFFIHPASSFDGDDWNVAIDDTDSSQRLLDRILPNQGAPFAKVGPFYAPRYRQASLWSEMNVGGEGDGAFLLAYKDVLDAFDRYVAQDNRARGVIIAGVGQGGLYAQRLLADRFQKEPMKQRLAAAYIIDAALPADAPGKAFSQPVCQSAQEIHCVVAWKTTIAGAEGEAFRDRSPIWTEDGRIAASRGHPLVCVNPLSWMSGNALAPRTSHLGGARATGMADLDPKIIPQAVSTRCRDGVLEVERPSAPELQADGGWGGRYKTPDYNLFYADILTNAADRARAASVWLDQNGAKPAQPLPPPTSLAEEGIHRPDGVVEPVPGSDN